MKVLYTGSFRFPAGDAAAGRVYSVAKLFEAAGCVVTFAGWEEATTPDGYFVYRGHDCYSQSEFRVRRLGAVRRVFEFLTRGRRTIRWLRSRELYDVVVLYNPPAIFALIILMWGKMRGFSVVLDSTEWYDPSHLPGGPIGLAAFENTIRMRLVYLLFSHVICISQFLEDYYRGRNVIKITPLISDGVCSASKLVFGPEIRLIYAGQPGRKDRLSTLIEILPELNEVAGFDVVLHVVGVDINGLLSHMNAFRSRADIDARFVVCHGRVGKEQVIELYKQCHFSIFFRENRRYAIAGFPTKAVESWSMGCPVITNRVGDVGVLGIDMQDSIFVNEQDLLYNLTEAFSNILSHDSFSEMSERCVRKAETMFSIEAIGDDFGNFLSRLGSDGTGRALVR